ncbi:MAG: DNA polymerase III subunit alpha [Actinomycetota bacterium]
MFVHLHCRSYFSLKDGAYSPEDLAVRAAELGMPAVALTDRDTLLGAVWFTDACARAGVKSILGARLTLGEDRSGRVVLLARDAAGYANLCRLISAAHQRGDRGEPWLSPREVMERAGGLVCLLGTESPPGAAARIGRPGAARELARPWREAFEQWCFVEVRDLLEPGSPGDVRRMLRLAAEAELPAVATNSVRHLRREDAFIADALECMREIAPVAEHHLSRRNAEGYLKRPEEMRALFADGADEHNLCDNTVRIAEACTFDLALGGAHFPDFPTPAGRSATSLLAERCHSGLLRRPMRRTREVLDRLDFELGEIRKMGYSAYFLTVADITDEIRRMGIRVAARGSAAGSLVCYLTGISEVDPVHHGLLFERFMNPLREDLPDIDIDVESARREEVYDMVLRRHGRDRCACVTMVDTYRARGAIREVGKALGYPSDEIDRVAKAFPHIGANRIRDALGSLPELRGSNLGAGQLEMLFRVAERLNGFPRHLALHPSGIVLSRDDLMDRVPLERSFLEHRMVQADKDDVERLGLLKLDVLGVRLLSSMRHTLDEIRRTTGERIDLDRIPRDDPAAFDLICSSRTIGCFQIESPGQRELLQKLQPDRFEDLIVDISLFRPGPVKADMVTPYINRRHGYQRPRYGHPALRPVLKETHGVIVYHEQIMRVLEVAGYSLAEADRIRRHLDDGAEIGEIEDAFVRKAVACGLGTDDADKVWRELASFASFGFCKAHAAAFAVPTYQSSWLKAHYPAHFLAGVLTHEPGMYPRRLVLEDARHCGVPILPLDVNRSQKAYSVEQTYDGYGIRLALQDVHGISDAEMTSIIKTRARQPLTSVDDFMRRTEVSRPVVEALTHAGAFDALKLQRGTRRDRLFTAMTADAPREGQQMALPLRAGEGPPGLREYTEAEQVRAELEVTGMDASRHVLSFYDPLLEELGVVRSKDLRHRRGREWVMVAGVKVSSQTPAVRSGQRIIFLTLDDATGPIEVTVFERVQEKCARTVFHGFALVVWGRLRRTGVEGVSIIAEAVWDLVSLARARREGRLLEAMAEDAPPDLARWKGLAGGYAAPKGKGREEAPRKLWHASGGSAGW